MSMIYELLKIIKKGGLKKVGINASSASSKLTERYMGLVLEGKAVSDAELANIIYETTKSAPKFKNLKRRVKQQLLDSLPQLPLELLGFNSEYNRRYYECMQACSRIWLLSRSSTYDSALEIIKGHYKTALKYEFYDILYQYSFHLVKIYSIRGDGRKTVEEAAKLSIYLKESNSIFQAKSIYLQISAQLIRNSKISAGRVEWLQEKVNELEALGSSTNEVNAWILYTKTYLYILQNNLQLLQKNISEYEDLMEDNKFMHPGRLSMLAIQKLFVLNQLKQYQIGLEYAQESEQLLLKKRNNWVLFKRFQFCLAINSNLGLAKKILNQVLKSDYYALQNNKAVTQLWLIHKAYFDLIDSNLGAKRKLDFNIYKFANDVELYSKDKSGYNFAIIVIELMFHLANNNVDRYIDRMTALMSYRIRHLKGKMFKRSNVFAQLLISVDKYGFNLSKIEERSHKKKEYLESLEDRLNINEWEIVDYATLWDITLDILKRK